jgi:hypothetical protein
MPDKPKIVMATVYLKSASGRSLLREGKAAPVGAQPYLSSSETMHQTADELQRLGFKIESRGVTLSISGPPELFEQTCGVHLSIEEIPVHEQRQVKLKSRSFFKSSQLVMHIQHLRDVIDGIVISHPGIPFENHSLPGE